LTNSTTGRVDDNLPQETETLKTRTVPGQKS